MSNDAAATSPSRSRVRDLAQAHEQAIDRANQQPVSPTLARKGLPQASATPEAGATGGNGGGDGDQVDREPKQAEAGAARSASTPGGAGGEGQSPKAADRTLETVPEGKAPEAEDCNAAPSAAPAATAAAPTDAAAPKKEALGSSSSAEAKEGATAAADKPVEEETQPLARILEALPSLGEKEQQIVQANLERVATYPAELPLSTSWSTFCRRHSLPARGSATADRRL